ncbi:tail fiber domain-containing protein [Bacillus cereus group sp. BfR-BA-00999]|uniref:tail fiber domain-containing protein n=1 Tax=Bacillus cereus group sp. BfR-BA-00999 TaxID=3094871 RepID=UPI0029C21CA4|nr:hypothetical protein [Bacillus cereus group sp. BfR-BA-00999]MDX5884892.1 hypothetical protein [Bacillus cereus group sp. BfR-BA-00999]
MARYIRYLENGTWKYASVKSVGDLEKLLTTSKTDIVSAINELIANGGALEHDLNSRFDGLEGQQNELVTITGNVQETLGKVQDDLLNKAEAMYVDEQIKKLVNKADYDANYQKIEGELLDKVNIDRYNEEYRLVTAKLNDKTDLSAFEGVEGRVTTTEQEITNVKGELGSKIGKTEFDSAVGLNRWLARKYDINIGSAGAIPSFSHIKGKQPNEVVDYDDNSVIKAFSGDYYIGHYFTNVYMKVAKTVMLTVTNDDGAVIYMNGAKMYESTTRTTGLSVALPFRAGWNTVEILHYEHSGAVEQVSLGLKLSTQVDKLTSVIGIGDKDDTRLVEAETQIKQNAEAILLKAEGSEVTSLGNKVTAHETSINLMKDEITMLVKTEDFNKYTGRLETAESKIIQHSDQISQKVEKKDYDALNNIVGQQQTSINQLTSEIDLKATKSDFDGLNGRVGNAETQINLNTEAINLRAKQTELDKTNGRLSTAEAQLSVQAGEIASKVTQEDIDESLSPIESRVGNAESTIVQHTTAIGLKANANEVYKKAEADGKISTAVTQAKGEIKLETDKIALNVTNLTKTVTEQGTTISNHETSITQMKGAINLKAEASNVYTKTEADNKTSTAISTAKAEIEVTTKGITQSVTNVQNDLKGVKDTVTAQGTQIKQTSDEVAINVVKKGNVKASINASTEGVKIGGQHVDITGQVTFQSLDPTMQGKVNAGTDAKNQFDNMQLGGNNIVSKKQITPINVASSSYDEATNTWTLTANSGAGGSWGAGVRITEKTSVVPIGSWFTGSFEIFSPIDATWNVDVNNFPVTGTSTSNDNDDTALRKTSSKSLKANTWTKCWFMWKNKDNSATDLYDQSNIGLINNSGSPVTFKIRNVKGELGNVVTDFSLAQQDIDDAIAKVQGNLDNMSIGGNNIISNSLFKTMGKWRAFGTTGGTKTAGVSIDLEGFPTGYQFESVTSGEYGLALDNVKTTIGETYTLSAWFKLTKAGVVKMQEGNSNVRWTYTKLQPVVGKWVRVTHTFVAKDSSLSIYAGADSSSPATAGFVTGVQLERGNKATDWSLSQTDIDEAIAIVQGNVDNITIGGSNLLLNSHADYSTTDYLIATYTLTENWVAGQEYTFVIKGTVPAGQKFGIWMNGGSNNVGYATTKYVDGVTYVTFKAVTPAGSHTKSLSLYNYPQNTTTSTVDWVALYRGNKPMDWQISSGDVQNLFTGADEKAEASKRAIADMSNDNKATSIEKQQLKKEWATITAEKPNYEALATTYGIATEKTNYVNAYNALNTAITPIIANVTVTSDINGATFRATFDDYYDKKSQLIKKINELARSIGTGADSKAQSAQSAIADMSSDSKITPVEKVQLKKEWAVMLSEKPQYEALATTYGITTERTNYVNSYNTLNTVLNGTGGILTNMATTSAVTGATFRAQFDDYYDKKAQLVRKINELSRSIGTNADNKAQEAKNLIADMSSDSKITPVEKVQLAKEWAVMVAEKPQYEALSTTYGITTEKTNFINAYNTLNTVLNGTGGILTSMTTTSTVTGSTFRGQFDDYYDKKAQLVKVINVKSKSLADGAQGTANTANTTANTVNTTINNNKATWDRASNINSDGTFNSTKLSGLILDAQISSAVNWNGAKSLLDSWKSGTTLINGGKIATNTIFAQQIAIGDFTNLSQINEEKNPNGYSTVLLNSKRYFKIGNGAYASIIVIANTYVEFKVNDEYYIAFNGYRDAGLTTLNAVFRYYYTDGTWENAGSVSVLPTTADTRIARNLKITTPPNDTKTLSAVNLFFEKDGTAGSGYYYIRDIEVRKRYTGELVVDGSIKAQQLDVASLFANTAFINNLKSQNISADKIVGGTIKGIRYESINASNPTIKLVLEGNSLKSYGAMDATAKKQNYAEMKDGGISVFEMAESGSPFGDRKAYVEPARFNAQQGDRSSAFEPTELRFWVPNMTGTVTFDVTTSDGGFGYGLRLEGQSGILVKNKNGTQYASIQFEPSASIFFDGYGNIKGGAYASSDATWSIKDADGRLRLLVGVGKGSTQTTEYASYGGGHAFYHNNDRIFAIWKQGDANYVQQFAGQGIFKWQKNQGRFEFRNGDDTNWSRVAGIVENASSRDYKKNISHFDGSALDIINASNARLYHYNNQDDSEKLNIGLIAEEAPQLVQGKDGKSVDGYGMTTLAWKAIQELSEQVRYLNEKINNK